MWIWNTNIYFWQQWPVYLHDRNDHGLIGCSRELGTVLAPWPSPDHWQAHSSTQKPPCSPLICPPTLPTPSPAGTAPTHSALGGHGRDSPTEQPQTSPGRWQQISLPQPPPLAALPGHLHSLPDLLPHSQAGLLVWVTHFCYSFRYQIIHTLICWAPGRSAQITQNSLELRPAPHWGFRAAAAWAGEHQHLPLADPQHPEPPVQ